jgi:hypothetical protein
MNADCGLIVGGTSAGPTQIYKTVNKGVTWTLLKDFGNQQSWGASMSFINSNTGWVQFGDHRWVDADNDYIYKTTNGGNNWTQMSVISGVRYYAKMKFISDGVGFLWIQGSSQLSKTTDHGASWYGVWQNPHSGQNGITDVQASPINLQHVYVSANADQLPYLIKCLNAFNDPPNIVTIANGYIDPYNLGRIDFLSIVNENGNDRPKICGAQGLAEVNNDNSIARLCDNPLSNVTAFKFSDPYFGIIKNGVAIMSSTTRGSTWTYEHSGAYLIADWLAVIGNVAYTPGENYTSILTRLIGVNLHSNCDWQGDIINGYHIIVDGVTKSTPQLNTDLRGGTFTLSLPGYPPVDEKFVIENNDTTKRFYYWGNTINASMNCYDAQQYLIYQNGNINADYKSKLKTNTLTALKNASQVKALVDTNGVTNLIYESMGGIFFTRTKPGGNFKTEEFLSGTSNSYTGSATFNNTHPYLTEVKSKNAKINPEKNVAAVWERYNYNQDNSKNINIIFSDRITTGPYNCWYVYNDPIATFNNAPQDFSCFPKVFFARNDGYDIQYRVITYIKPMSGYSKLVGKYKWSTYEFEFDITNNTAGYIEEYAVAPVFTSGDLNRFDLHIVYKFSDGKLYYKHQLFDPYEQSHNTGEDFILSNLDILQDRGDPDITLRNSSYNPANVNLQPVVFFKGTIPTRIQISQQGDFIYTNNYAVIWRERDINSNWSNTNSWLVGSCPQQDCNIEGSRGDNSYIINYSINCGNNNNFNLVVPRWNGYTNYHSTPGELNVQDAKIIRGGIINQSCTIQAVFTLTNSQSPYQLTRQPITISNTPYPQIDEYNGLVVTNNTKYSLALGCVLVNGQQIYFNEDLPDMIGSAQEYNNLMRTKNFYLNNNDTLIIGRSTFYGYRDDIPFIPLSYVINLVSMKDNSIINLISGTINSTDIMNTELLDGYVIDNIESDSFYVEIRVDEFQTYDSYNITRITGGFPTQNGGDKPVSRYVNFANKHAVPNIPKEFALHQNYPNPFNPVTKIKYDIPKNTNVTIKVYDIIGREVTTLINNEFKNAGWYQIDWNASNYASGIYFYRIQAADYTSVKKMVLIK